MALAKKGQSLDKEFGEKGFKDFVGETNIAEASVLFGIIRSSSAARLNGANTLAIMTLARKANPITAPKAFAKTLRMGKRPGGQKLAIKDQDIISILKFYKTGEFKSPYAIKTTTYSSVTRAHAMNDWTPWAVMDVHMARALGVLYVDIGKKTRLSKKV